MTNFGIVSTPTFDWLAKQAQSCESRMLVGSPYVNNGIIRLTGMVSPSVSRTLVTRTDLRDFAVGSSNLDTLCSLAREGVAILSLSALHAKMYIFDDTSALVTSANATASGMWRNIECGLSVGDKRVVKRLAKSLLSGFGAGEPPRMMKREELEALNIPLEAIKASLPKPNRSEAPDTSMEIAAAYSIQDKEMFLKGFKGWQALVLEGVLDMPEDGFRIGDLLKTCGPKAARRYPRNQHVAAKLRQQLQRLRDIGIVEFVQPGFYRNTMNRGWKKR